MGVKDSYGGSVKYLFCFVMALCQLHFDSKVDMWHAVKKAVDYAESHHIIYWSIAEDDNDQDVHSCWLCWKI